MLIPTLALSLAALALRSLKQDGVQSVELQELARESVLWARDHAACPHHHPEETLGCWSNPLDQSIIFYQ